MAVATIQYPGFATAAQIAECIQVRAREVLDMDVVAYAGPVRGVVVGAEYRNMRALADHCLAGDPPTLVAVADDVRKVLGWEPRYDDLDTIVTHSLAWERKLAQRTAQAEAKASA